MTGIRQITPQEFQAKLDASEDMQLVDIREEYEYESFNIEGENIPLFEIDQHLDKISKTKPVIIHCDFGLKSKFAIHRLQTEFGFTNLYSLEGGIKNYINYFNSK